MWCYNQCVLPKTCLSWTYSELIFRRKYYEHASTWRFKSCLLWHVQLLCHSLASIYLQNLCKTRILSETFPILSRYPGVIAESAGYHTYLFSISTFVCKNGLQVSNHLLFQKLSLGMRQRTCRTLEEEVTKKSNSFSPLKEQKFLGGRSLKGGRKKNLWGAVKMCNKAKANGFLALLARKCAIFNLQHEKLLHS